MLHAFLMLMTGKGANARTGTSANESAFEAAAEDGTRRRSNAAADESAAAGPYAVTVVLVVVAIIVVAIVVLAVVIVAIVIAAVMVTTAVVATAVSTVPCTVVEIIVAVVLGIGGCGAEQKGKDGQGAAKQMFGALKHFVPFTICLHGGG